jgi:ABC-type branched-subunit amino acid transport system substrate-binding protein
VNRAALALLILSAGILAACGRVERRVRIVLLTDLTGPHSVSGEGIRRAAALALAERRHMLLEAGWNVDLVAFDAYGSAPGWQTTLRAVSADPDAVCAVVHTDTNGNLSAAEIFHSAGIALVLPAETASLPSAVSRPETVFLSPDDRTHGASDAEWALSHSAARIFLTTDSGPHALSIGDGFRDRAQAGGSTVYVFRIHTAQDLSAWTSSFKSIHPDLVYFSGSSTLAQSILGRMAASGYPGSLFFAQDNPEDPLPATFASESVTQMFSPATADSAGAAGVPALLEAYRTAYGADPPATAALGYDAAAFCLSPLLKNNAGGMIPSDARSWFLDQLRAGGVFHGLTGVYNLDGERPGRIPIYLHAQTPGSEWAPVPTPGPVPRAIPIVNWIL